MGKKCLKEMTEWCFKILYLLTFIVVILALKEKMFTEALFLMIVMMNVRIYEIQTLAWNVLKGSLKVNFDMENERFDIQFETEEELMETKLKISEV